MNESHFNLLNLNNISFFSHSFILPSLHPFSMLASSWAQYHRGLLHLLPASMTSAHELKSWDLELCSACCFFCNDDRTSLDALAPAVGSFQTLCCPRPRTTTTPSGRKERSSPAPSTPTSWKRSSRLLAPKPPASLTHPLPHRASLHPCLSPRNSYPVSQFRYLHFAPNLLTGPVTVCLIVWWCVSFDREDSPERPPPPAGVSDNRQCVLCLKYGDENTNVSRGRKKKSSFVVFKCDIASALTRLLLSGWGKAAVHRPERVDSRQLRAVVRRGLWGRRRRPEERPHGGFQRETTGEANLFFFFPALHDCGCRTESNRLPSSVHSTARSARSLERPSAAASPRAPVTTTSCALASVTAASWRTRRFIAQSTSSSLRER